MPLFTTALLTPRRPDLAIEAEGLRLRPPEIGDYAAWSTLREQSRAFLTPWEPTWPVDDLALGAFRLRLRRYRREITTDEAYPFFIFDGAGTLMGGATLSNVRRGAANSATLGYWMGARFANRGIMTRAATALCRHAFGPLGLDRVEAACLPENGPSIHLLGKIGFVREGLARDYLSINGRRRDHLLFALLKRDLMFGVGGGG